MLLTTRYKYQGKTIESEISAVLWFDAMGIPPQPPKPKKKDPIPAEKYIVYVAVDDLALRAEPSVSGYLMKRLVAESELISLEPKANADGKIGHQGQWLKVQESGGEQGYVAAWYISKDKGDIPPPGTTAPTVSTPASAGSTSTTSPDAPPPAGALALIPTEEVAFRASAVISPETLIRRVPATEQVISVEPADQTIAKIGVVGQWINVQDNTGQKGFMAAWYLNYASGSTAAETESSARPSAPGEPIMVRSTAEGVAFRKEPIISGRTIIRRLPLGTELSIAEQGGESKIGSSNKWLKVMDATGTEGYISAWFVAR